MQMKNNCILFIYLLFRFISIHSFTFSLTHLAIHSLICPSTHSFTHLCSHSIVHQPTHSLHHLHYSMFPLTDVVVPVYASPDSHSSVVCFLDQHDILLWTDGLKSLQLTCFFDVAVSRCRRRRSSRHTSLLSGSSKVKMTMIARKRFFSPRNAWIKMGFEMSTWDLLPIRCP